VDVRLARWLLMQHDRAEGAEFPMTHEFLALMLAARRPGISVAAGVLQRAGAISYTHGRMAVLDRAGLEAAACECYGVVRELFDELLGAAAG
jgi:CRP-like cAMP-binding protein